MVILFIISGALLAMLITAKVWEERRRRKPFLLKLVSLGDERLRMLSHEAAHRYSEYRSDLEFFVSRQLPFRTRNFVNKTNLYMKNKSEKYMDELRQSKLFKKNEGLSEFFRNISEKEIDSQKGEDEVK